MAAEENIIQFIEERENSNEDSPSTEPESFILNDNMVNIYHIIKKSGMNPIETLLLFQGKK